MALIGRDAPSPFATRLSPLAWNPAAFGCVKAADVGDSYSWRGNVAMVCSRLEGTTDPGLPVSLLDVLLLQGWAGWKPKILDFPRMQKGLHSTP